MMKTTILIGGMLLSAAVHAQSVTDLTLRVHDFKNLEGKLMVALYQGEQTYLKKTFREADTLVYDQKEVLMVFKNLSEGEYAISIFHDENGNGSLDTNFMGIPTEPYAFSNNAPSRFGPASYEDARFSVSQSNNIHTIKIN